MDEKDIRRQEEEISHPLQRLSPSNMSLDYRVGKNPHWGGSLSLTEYKVSKGDGATDASTQTKESIRRTNGQETHIRGVSIDNGSLELEANLNHKNQALQVKENSEHCREEISPPSSSSTSSS
uniref:Uncharacterized protein n=1 Tax=Nelumbo nucifera TaxID=4432 RepID=A0A822Y6J2_NELNU|nr:TPA_asm: hypothetical protein HUJ06_031082 [Nelumbo nucifera]